MDSLQCDMRGYRLLYVDDDADARRFLGRIIARKYPDLKIYVAENGVEGLEIFREQRPDIVLADIAMPDMDGIQMAREIKVLDADAVIVALTAYNETCYLQDAIEVGIRNYLLKPIVSTDLFTVIEKNIREIGLMRLLKEQERQIRTREQQLAMAQKITHLGSWEWDVDSGRMSWSDELYQILGFEPESTTASYKKLLERVHPEDRKAESDGVRNALKKCRPIASHYCRIVRPDQSVRTVHVRGEVLLDSSGKLVSVIGTAHDVTERRQMDEERARLAMIVESSNEAIFSVALDGTITSWNRGAENIFGYSAGEITGLHIFTIIPVELHDERSRILQAVINGEQVQNFESTRIRKDGVRIYVSITSSPIRDANGKIIGNSVIARDETERRQMLEIIKHQAQHDTLTDLPNRNLFMDFLSLELAEARRNDTKLALLFLDLNGFKQVNDTLGHSYGDCLLQEVAQRLRGSIRESDTVARLGGDEFTVLMPNLAQTEVVSIVLNKILNVFERPFVLDGVTVETTTSIGVSMYPDDGSCSDELMRKADIAMYDAKRSGNNSYQFYNDEINARTVKRLKMEDLLRRSVGNGELDLLFQPLVDSDTRSVVGAEALLRWRHPEWGMLAPDQFLEAAEDSGAIVPIGEWVIRNACDQARSWNENGYPLCVAVNLSNRQFHRPDLVENTARILAETGLTPHRLEFDVTENTLMADIDFSLRSMQALNDMGVAIAIDNFGCGSSSVNWIKKMHAGKVKIDRSFVKNMMNEPDDLAVVNAVVAMTHNLNMKVVAHGVETEEQLSVVRKSGCDQLLGYLISRPLHPGDFERFVVNY